MDDVENVWLNRFDRAKFLDLKGDPNTIGIVIDVEIVEGQRSYQVLEESREDGAQHPWQENNPYGAVHYWDFHAWERLGKASVEEMLLSENEMIREYAKSHMEEIQQATDTSSEEIESYQRRQDFKKKIEEATEDELSRIIDSL